MNLRQAAAKALKAIESGESFDHLDEVIAPLLHAALAESDRQGGMTLRDYFAAQALTGAQIWDAVLNGTNAAFANGGVDKLAETAYAVADAMLKARGQA